MTESLWSFAEVKKKNERFYDAVSSSLPLPLSQYSIDVHIFIINCFVIVVCLWLRERAFIWFFDSIIMLILCKNLIFFLHEFIFFDENVSLHLLSPPKQEIRITICENWNVTMHHRVVCASANESRAETLLCLFRFRFPFHFTFGNDNVQCNGKMRHKMRFIANVWSRAMV